MLQDRRAPLVQAEATGRSGSNNRRIEEEARSVHTDRHYDKSARSNKSQERAGSQRSRDISPKDADNKSQRSNHSQVRDGSAHSARSNSYQYNKLTSSLVSNPDNLVCDDCVNRDMGDQKVVKAAALRDADKEHANRTHAELKRQLEEEKEKHLQKLRLYREGVEGQNADLQAKRAKALAEEEAEKKKIRKQLNDKSDLIAKEKEMLERRDKFRAELADQVAGNEDARAKAARDQEELDRKNHNLVIDDGWRAPQQKALKEYYKGNLLNQLGDNEAARAQAAEAKKRDDEQYTEEVKAYNERDRAQRARIEAEKRDLLKNELQKQLGENDDKRRQAADEKNEEDEKYRAKIAFDNGVFYENMEKRRNIVQGHMQDLINQKQEAEAARKAAALEEKKPQGTGLHVPQKMKKCYNCAICRLQKPLERLNKRYKMSRK
jgi:hypothetical protein